MRRARLAQHAVGGAVAHTPLGEWADAADCLSRRWRPHVGYSGGAKLELNKLELNKLELKSWGDARETLGR